jgi:uncharacterized membrane protein YidH (DUF202 family)
MNKITIELFVKLFNFYKKWGDTDAFFSTSFVLSVLIGSTLNFINSLIYFLLNIEGLRFNLNPIGVILLLIIICCTAYFNSKKEFIKKVIDKRSKEPENKDYLVNAILLFMFSTWILAPILYKIGST